MTYNVFGGTLNLALSIYLLIFNENDEMMTCTISLFTVVKWSNNSASGIK